MTKSHRKKLVCLLFIVILAIVLMLLAATIAYFTAFYPHRGTSESLRPSLNVHEPISSDKAVEDLDFIYGLVCERHPAFLNGSELPSAFEARYKSERDALLSNENTTVLQLWQAAAKALSELHDGHTTVRLNPNEEHYVTLPDNDQRTITAINGIDIQDLYDNFKTMFFYEEPVEFYARFMFYRLILRESWLNFMGIDAAGSVEFSFDNGDVERFVLGAPPASNEVHISANTEYTIDTEHSLGIITLYECNPNEEYLATLDSFFSEVFANNITKIAVDLRENGGGNSNVINEFFRYLDVSEYKITGGLTRREGSFLLQSGGESIQNNKREQTFKGDIYVLTSNDTFSSATMFACAVSDNGIGSVIGEKPGNMPQSYGDVLTFQTPNAGLVLGVSYKEFLRIDAEKAQLPLEPDYPCDREDALDTLYSLIK